MTSQIRPVFTHPLIRIGSALAIVAGLSAPSLLHDNDGTRLASVSEIRKLTQAVALCPSLSSDVADMLESSMGAPSSREAQLMTETAKGCLKMQKQMPESMQRASAFAALQSSIEANTYHLPQERPAGTLKLSLSLGGA